MPLGWLKATLSLIKLKQSVPSAVAAIEFGGRGAESKCCDRIKCQKSSQVVDILFTLGGFD